MTGKAYAVKQARKILNQYRSAHGESYNSEKYEIDPETIARLLGIDVLHHQFSDNISGLFFKKNNKLYIGVNSSQSEHRKRFTLAHEIGHFLLHTDESFHFDQDNVLYRADSILSSTETEANHFAAEILMPEEICSVN